MRSQKTRESRAPGGDKHAGTSNPPGPMQVVARDMKRWLLMLTLGLGALGVAAVFMGLLPVASMLAAIVLVSFTLYLFLRFWPEDEVRPRRVPGSSAADSKAPRRAMVQAVKVDGPPRSRFMIALRDVARRQESFRISQQGAERFARTIRYLLRSGGS